MKEFKVVITKIREKAKLAIVPGHYTIAEKDATLGIWIGSGHKFEDVFIIAESEESAVKIIASVNYDLFCKRAIPSAHMDKDLFQHLIENNHYKKIETIPDV